MARRGQILCRQLRGVYRSTVATATVTSGRTGEAQRRFLHVGERASLTKVFSACDAVVFAKLTGDVNPIHWDLSYARTTPFEKPIVHGVLINGLISAVLGTKLPGGGCIFLSQEIRFPAPLFTGEEVLAEAEVREINKPYALISVSCSVKDKIVMEGQVKVIVPE
ncbi:hypothetical protein AGOR_G00132580 [Albula goreensis]|uniref:MaoC-like domain-containing protein n=1 Tax=Albula goreensis TaxID=1534307 RepID=A0A8T3D8H9_9TELE|nr:hypothetical protein AGOR_G00132580 [Albula goreensis]